MEIRQTNGTHTSEAANRSEKEAVRAFWAEAPCGSGEVDWRNEREGSLELEAMRDAREPFIREFARFDERRGKEMLEVGVGAGTDHMRLLVRAPS